MSTEIWIQKWTKKEEGLTFKTRNKGDIWKHLIYTKKSEKRVGCGTHGYWLSIIPLYFLMGTTCGYLCVARKLGVNFLHPPEMFFYINNLKFVKKVFTQGKHSALNQHIYIQIHYSNKNDIILLKL